MSPTPVPIKAISTKHIMSGLLVIAPTKEVIQPTALVTILVMSLRIEAKVTAVSFLSSLIFIVTH